MGRSNECATVASGVESEGPGWGGVCWEEGSEAGIYGGEKPQQPLCTAPVVLFYSVFGYSLHSSINSLITFQV